MDEKLETFLQRVSECPISYVFGYPLLCAGSSILINLVIAYICDGTYFTLNAIFSENGVGYALILTLILGLVTTAKDLRDNNKLIKDDEKKSDKIDFDKLSYIWSTAVVYYLGALLFVVALGVPLQIIMKNYVIAQNVFDSILLAVFIASGVYIIITYKISISLNYLALSKYDTKINNTDEQKEKSCG
ncbi:hypothetical protein [Macrococcoides canis]|uniref:hypothetical protein n=1 Tax=Macrococcoides canis TaxID=1855823 RepID=UPI0020B6A316|nr:hypothetical protein [Macrococcus canis]UTH11589.1 hypothetical protein KFV10_00260 [Macrococcus canis]